MFGSNLSRVARHVKRIREAKVAMKAGWIVRRVVFLCAPFNPSFSFFVLFCVWWYLFLAVAELRSGS